MDSLAVRLRAVGRFVLGALVLLASKSITLGASRRGAAGGDPSRFLVADDAVQDGTLVKVGKGGVGLPAEEVACDLEDVVLRAALLGLGRQEVAQVPAAIIKRVGGMDGYGRWAGRGGGWGSGVRVRQRPPAGAARAAMRGALALTVAAASIHPNWTPPCSRSGWR